MSWKELLEKLRTMDDTVLEKDVLIFSPDDDLSGGIAGLHVADNEDATRMGISEGDLYISVLSEDDDKDE